jgi:uncharacterized protein (DUF2461 family)
MARGAKTARAAGAARTAKAGREPHFDARLFAFLTDLAAHNDRAWFQDNKDRFEADVREPLRRFIVDFAPRLARISRQFTADPRRQGGSMFRIHRDTRFSKDKRPYKTHVAAQFRHKGPGDALPEVLRAEGLPFGATESAPGTPAGGDVHGPGFYLHLEPGEVFMAAGMWRPERPALQRIRDRIAASPEVWRQARDATYGKRGLYPDGDALKRPPRGYDPEHPMIEDLKRTDFVIVADLSEAQALRPDFLDRFTACCRAAVPYMRFLTEAVGLPW